MFSQRTAILCGGTGMLAGEFTERVGALPGDGVHLGTMVGMIHSGMVLTGAAIGDRYGTIIRIIHTMEVREDGRVPVIPIGVRDVIRRVRPLHITAIIPLHMAVPG